MKRRLFIHAAPALLATPTLSAVAQGASDDAKALEQALRTGGVVLAARHALAPGNFDPPGFKIGDCATQRQLSDEGRAQARRLGEWMKTRQLKPAQVRSSPWCRCEETARLAFGSTQTWMALGSTRGFTEEQNRTHQRELRQALRDAAQRQAPFEVWVTHNFVLNALVGGGAGNAETLVLRAGAGDTVDVLARYSVG